MCAAALTVLTWIVRAEFVIVERLNDRVQLCPSVSPYGDCTTVAGGTNGDGDAQLNRPFGCVIDVSGDYLISDFFNNRVQLCPAARPQSNCSTVAKISQPAGLALTPEGDYLIVSRWNSVVHWCSASSAECEVVAGVWGQEGSTSSTLKNPRGIALDAAGDYLIADYNNNRVQLCPSYSAGSDCTTVAGTDGKGNNATQLEQPFNVKLDADGNYLVADTFNHRIQLCSASSPGTGCTTVVGSSAGLSEPRDCILDETGQNYVVVDAGRIQLCPTGGFGDSCETVASQMRQPWSVIYSVAPTTRFTTTTASTTTTTTASTSTISTTTNTTIYTTTTNTTTTSTTTTTTTSTTTTNTTIYTTTTNTTTNTTTTSTTTTVSTTVSTITTTTNTSTTTWTTTTNTTSTSTSTATHAPTFSTTTASTTNTTTNTTTTTLATATESMTANTTAPTVTTKSKITIATPTTLGTTSTTTMTSSARTQTSTTTITTRTTIMTATRKQTLITSAPTHAIASTTHTITTATSITTATGVTTSSGTSTNVPTTAIMTTSTAATVTTREATTISSITTNGMVSTNLPRITTVNPAEQTTTTTTFFEPSSCFGEPDVMHSVNIPNCSGMIDGSACVIECPVGYVWPLQEDVLCSGGVWLVWAQCIPNGASWTSARVAEILVLVNPGSIPGSQDVMFDVAWVQENLDLMVQTSADLLALSPHKVQIEVLDLAKTRRQRQRRLNAGEFLLRFLVVDDADTTAANLAEQLLCVLFTCTEHGPAWVGSPVLTNATHITHVSVAGFVGDVTSSLLLNSIVVVLEETGSVVPAGMLNCELLVSNSQVRVVYGFVMPVAAWLEGSWMCSTTCGTGVCSRSVSCSLGSSVACAAISSKPQECEECEQCSLNHFCPWPGRDGGSCEVAYVALGAVALLFLCCFLFLCHRRRRLRGKVRLKTIEGTARFSTTWERNEDQSSGSVSTKKRITWEYDQKVLNALYADADLISETGTGLIDGQIVREDERGGDTMSTWLETSGDEALGGRGASMRSSVMETRLFCLDLVGPSDWYDTASSSAQEESSGTLEGHGKTEDEMDVPSSSSTRSQENSSESSAPHHSSASRTTWRSYLLTAMPHEGNAGSLKVRPAYPEKCEVEYYSGTNQCWVTAFVSLSYLEENVNGIQRVIDVIYNIRIGFTLQHRQHVELHLLRKPLLQKELVDVRLPSGVWVPGCISRVARGPRNRIYTVELDDPPNTQQGHQVFVGHQLRRRFPVDSAVCVYCGVSQGWVSGVIAEGTPFVSGSPSAQLRRTGNASTGSASVGSMTSSCFSSPAPPIAKVRKSTDQRRGGASIDVAPFGLGLIAPGQDRVVLVHLADRDEVEWVPEYLVDSVSLV